MDKNTFLAIILSVVVISVGFVVQTTFFMPDEPVVSEQPVSEAVAEAETTQPETTAVESVTPAAKTDDIEFDLGDENYVSRSIEAETDFFKITFDTDGAVISSLKLKEHLDGEEPVEMI